MRFVTALLIAGLLASCAVLPQMPTPTPTRNFSAPTIAPTADIVIRNSDQLYGDTIIGGQSNATAAALPVGAALPPRTAGDALTGAAQPAQLVLNDGTLVTVELYQPADGTRLPGVLILADDMLGWRSAADALLNSGYTVMLVPVPAEARAEIVSGLLDSFSEDGALDPARIAVMGAQETADLALLGCAIDARCDAVLMLSPLGGAGLVNVLPNVNPRPLLVIAARSDAESFASAQGLAANFAAGSRLIELATGRGSGMLALNSALTPTIIAWLDGVFRG